MSVMVRVPRKRRTGPPPQALARPRVATDAANVSRLKTLMTTDAQLQGDYDALVAEKGTLIAEVLPSEFNAPNTKWNKAAVSAQQDTTIPLAFLYLMDPVAHADAGARVVTRVLNQCENAACELWTPTSWLTMGLATPPVAIGYDWCYNAFTPAERDRAEAGMVGRGIDKYLSHSGPHSHNWGGQIYGGMGMLAWAIKGEGTAETKITDTLSKVDADLRDGVVWRESGATKIHDIISPEGGYAEGGYLDYYLVNLLNYFATHRTSSGSEHPHSTQMPGLPETVRFYRHKVGPPDPVEGRRFHMRMADGADNWVNKGDVFWAGYMARRYDLPLARHLLQESRSFGGVEGRYEGVCRFLNYEASSGATVQDADAVGEPLDRLFTMTAIWAARSSWTDPNARYVYSRVGGHLDEAHQHIDRGAVQFVADGVDYLGEMGEDMREGGLDSDPAVKEYDDFFVPTVENPDRWRFPRLRGSGHSLGVLNPGDYPDQRPSKWNETEKHPVVEKTSGVGAASPFCVVDLSPSYTPGFGQWAGLTSYKRGIKLHNRDALIVQDEIRGTTNQDFYSLFSTRRAVTVAADGRSAAIDAPGAGTKRLYCRILTPGGVFAAGAYGVLEGVTYLFTVVNDNTGIRTLFVRLSGAPNHDLCVYFEPMADGEADPTVFPAVQALSVW